MGLFNFPQVDSNVNVIFSVDGDEYAVEQFKIGFHQPVDNLKNQPEGEVRGGRIMITLSQTVKSNIYGWAVKPWVKKNGAVLFKTGTSGVIFEVAFTNAYCTSYMFVMVVFSSDKVSPLSLRNSITIGLTLFSNSSLSRPVIIKSSA